jgi:hypothetical protein
MHVPLNAVIPSVRVKMGKERWLSFSIILVLILLAILVMLPLLTGYWEG